MAKEETQQTPEYPPDGDGVEQAKQFVEEAEFGSRKVIGLDKYAISIIAAAWSLFQLSLPKFIMLSAVYIRAIHLAFAITLVYLSYPAFKKVKTTGPFSFLSRKRGIPIIDWILAIVAALAALYLAIDYEGLSMRQGAALDRDIWIGLVLLVLLLEAARRSIGPALSVVALVFTLYSFFGPYMPELIAFKGVSLGRYMAQITMSTEGIYGVPLDVAATVVFLFVLFGAMLERAGGGQYFVQLAFSLLGRFKGGPAKAAVLASGMTGLISGSSIANTVTTGTFTIPMMKKVGYPGTKAAAVEVAASTNGQLMPPIMGAAAFIIAEYCNLAYFDVIRAAFVPAIVSYIALIYITHLEASKLGLQGVPKEELPDFFPLLLRGIYYFIPLFFLIYELVIIRRSPELSAFYAIVVLALLMVVKNLVEAYLQQESLLIGLKRGVVLIWNSLVAGGRNMMGIGVAVAAAGIIVGVVTMGLGNRLTDIIDQIAGGNLIVLLIITAIASLILGMGLPTTANYVVMASLTAPAIVWLAADYGFQVPLIAAHLFVFFFGILADDTPPVGLAAYAAAAIAKSPPIPTGVQGFLYDIRTAILPFMFIFNVNLLLLKPDGTQITSWLWIAAVFINAVIAMFAFANLTQHFFIAKNRLYESVLLVLVVALLMRPDYFIDFIPYVGGRWGKGGMYVLGLMLYGLIYLMQRPRAHRRASAVST
ncbi:TRAP transporter fused permease subunit [candidate division KSB3 bacterium]|uniref:TRAP transporter fused permease subunit n=1 Tax=candidate division KSB3 bacterium TaxID=2044937 RepID=A0A9D5JXK5_9BACT|nr:TRAP transporter fused permease subunit [candidate division KSB3 bacterium]MBD3326013.1 TRAP transporter fused permease subunit [candidate division KSB3 bacterium]